VLNSLAQALNLSAEVLLDQAGLLRNIQSGDLPAKPRASNSTASNRSLSNHTGSNSTEEAIRADELLSAAQKHALLSVYRSYVSAGRGSPED
jgi:hypothetical protein